MMSAKSFRQSTRWLLQTLFILSLVATAQQQEELSAQEQTAPPAKISDLPARPARVPRRPRPAATTGAPESTADPQNGAEPASTTTAPAAEQGQTAVPAKNEEPMQGKSEREVTQASNEAGKTEESDETARFKYSNSVKIFSRAAGLDVKTGYWVFTILNFLIIAGFMYWIWRKVWPGVVRSRNERLSRALEEARRASADAQFRLGQIEARLSRLDGEIAEIKAQAENEASTEEQRIRHAGEEEKQRILTAADQEIASASAQARRDLKAFAAQIAVDLARTRITSSIDANADEQLVREFAARLGKDGNA